MADAKPGMADNWFAKIEDYIGQSISTFAASIFLIFTMGAVFGHLFTQTNPNLLVVPAVLGVLAYYNRAFAVIALGVFAVIFFI